MGIVAPLIKEKVKNTKGKTQKRQVQEKAIDVLVAHARLQGPLWKEIVAARKKLIDKALRKKKSTNPFSKTIAEKFAKIGPPR